MNEYRAYFTRHMPIALHARLRALVKAQNAANGRGAAHTLEETINEALALGAAQLEAAQTPTDRWAAKRWRPDGPNDKA